MSKRRIGVVGVAVMGRDLCADIESRGYAVLLFQPLRKRRKK
ncbi:NAD(P)-binding domain-containing protein [Escherichia coli]